MKSTDLSSMGIGVDESLGMETVTRSGDYVVVLVGEDRRERRLPVGQCHILLNGSLISLLIYMIFQDYPKTFPGQ
jgi:hypothetical protein